MYVGVTLGYASEIAADSTASPDGVKTLTVAVLPDVPPVITSVELVKSSAVSYTHLTLPTKRIV